MVKIIGNGQGGTDWNQLGATLASALTGGDQLTPALKRAQMQAEMERARGQRLTNDGIQSTIDLSRTDSLANLFGSGNRDYQAAIAGASGGDISKLIEMARAQTAYNPANTELGDMTTRSQIAAGADMGKTYQGFTRAQNDAISMNNADNAQSAANQAASIAEQARQYNSAPEKVFDPTANQIINVPRAQATDPRYRAVISNSDMQGTLNAGEIAKPIDQQYAGVGPEARRALNVDTNASLSNISKMQEERDSLFARKNAMPLDDARRMMIDRRIEELDRGISQSNRSYETTIDKAVAENQIDATKNQQTIANQLTNLTVLDQLANDSLISGSLQGTREAASKFLQLFGADEAALANTATFRSFANKAVLENMGGSLGTGISNADRDFIQNQVANLSLTPQSIRSLIGTQKALLERKAQIEAERERWAATRGLPGADFQAYIAQKFANVPLMNPAASAQNNPDEPPAAPTLPPGVRSIRQVQ